MDEKPIDRFVRKLRPAFWVASLVALPVFFASYYQMIALLFEHASRNWFVFVVICHIIAMIAFGSLLDHRRESQIRPQCDQ